MSCEGLLPAQKATRQCEFTLAGHMLLGGCSSCNHVRCTKTATSYNYQFPLDHLLLNRASLSGRLLGKRRSDPDSIADRRQRYDAVQVSLPRGEELSASQPRPSFETRPARGRPHIMIVAESTGPRQAPNVFGDLSTALQATPDCLSGSQPHFIRSGSLRSAIVCWNLLIFDGPERRNVAARRALEG